MRKAGDARDGPGPQRGAVHDGGVKLDLAEQVGQAADADVVVGLVGLDDPDRGLYRVHGAAARSQQFDSGGEADLAALTRDHDRCDGYSSPSRWRGTRAVTESNAK